MIFASFAFLFWFAPLFFALYWLLPRRGRNLLLTLASYGFYGWWRPDYVVLMLASTAVDYACGRAMARPGARRRLWLLLSVCTNLGLLGYFKYANLLVSTANSLLASPLPWEEVVLPIGISFYTFQSMSYTIDVYRGKVRPARSFLDLACYVAMFPQLVAGPIVRYRDVQDELHRRRADLLKVTTGLFLFAIGFSKKVLIADQVGPLADAAFAMPAPGMLAAWTGVGAYALQIYFDFSGYSDMAIGLGLMLGFTFPRNFHSPYKSQSITEFWRRWHISLSTWLRDYLYVPLGGNRHGVLRTYRNLALTMLLGGLWHGAQWTFVLWGAYQGLFLVIERLRGKSAPYGFLPAPLRVAVTFLIVLGGWVIFRAEGVGGAAAMYAGMFGAHGIGQAPALPFLTGAAYAMAALGLLLVFFGRDSWSLVRRFHPLTMAAAFGAFAAAVCHLLATDYSPFLYFQF